VFNIVKGSTILIPSGPAGDKDRKHLHVALSDPFTDASDNESKILLVSVCSVVEGVPHDATCLLQAGDHSFVDHKSYAYYALAILAPVRGLEECCARRKCRLMDPVSRGLLARLRQGALDSRQTKPRIKGLCRR
jgi:hypothetical protein